MLYPVHIQAVCLLFDKKFLSKQIIIIQCSANENETIIEIFQFRGIPWNWKCCNLVERKKNMK